MANTVIQLKYSEITATPTLLNVAEPAYSNSSGKLFIGDNNSTPVLIGGKYYVDRVDEATSANTANVIVKRDSAGSFSASVVRAALYGNANTATTLLNGRNFGLTGPDITSGNISFDGSAAVTLQANLSTTGVAAGTYGGTSQIPTFAVDSRGRIQILLHSQPILSHLLVVMVLHHRLLQQTMLDLMLTTQLFEQLAAKQFLVTLLLQAT